MSDDDFPTREQEAVISRLAIEHGGIRVARLTDERVVRLGFPYSSSLPDVWLDEDGCDVTTSYYRDPDVFLRLPVDLVVDLLGRERYDAALASIRRSTTHESFSLGRELGGEILPLLRNYVTGDEPDTMLVHFVFEGPPGPDGPRFIETETIGGRGLGVGQWVELGGGHWAIECRVAAADVREA